MNITNGTKVRVKNTLIQGKIVQIGCDKCTIDVNERELEYNTSELTECIWPTAKRFLKETITSAIEFRSKLESKVFEFVEDKKGHNTVKVIIGFLIATAIVVFFTTISNK
ncbi:MAG: hypothetical protein JZU53_07185 [Paludibacter sp.]|nr:hypothetical protein [Paludibacter sp.]